MGYPPSSLDESKGCGAGSDDGEVEGRVDDVPFDFIKNRGLKTLLEGSSSRISMEKERGSGSWPEVGIQV